MPSFTFLSQSHSWYIIYINNNDHIRKFSMRNRSTRLPRRYRRPLEWTFCLFYGKKSFSPPHVDTSGNAINSKVRLQKCELTVTLKSIFFSWAIAWRWETLKARNLVSFLFYAIELRANSHWKTDVLFCMVGLVDSKIVVIQW